MSAAVAQRNSPHMPRSSNTSRNQSPMDKKAAVKKEDLKESSSPANQHKDIKSPPRPDPPTVVVKEDTKDVKQPEVPNAGTAQPLAPPPKPSQSNEHGGDYFSAQHGNSHYNLEPNLFEQSFGTGNTPDTPGKSLLPPVASLTSPQLLTGGSGIGSGFWQGGSLRSGPLSPAMLSGPTGPGDYFDSSLRGSFPTPNESSLRTGLTPGGGGSMFPAASPSTQALYNSLQSGGATPNALEFQRSAMNAAVASKAKAQNGATSQPPTSQAHTAAMPPTSQPAANTTQFSNDNEAANGLYLLAQAGNESQSNNQFAVPPQPAHVNDKRNNGSIGGNSVPGDGSENPGSEGDSKSNTRKPKRASGGGGSKANNKRKNEDTPAKPASKKTKAASIKSDNMSMDDDSDQEEIKMQDHDENGRKMTDEEKRKNFLERNRVAALKCRQRKKQWLANLQAKVEIFSTENDALNSQVSSLREEILNLKTILIAHKDCPISQGHQQSVSQYMPPQNQDYQHQQYSHQGQPVMTGPRRYS